MSSRACSRVRRLGLPLIAAALTLLGCQDAPSQAAAPAAPGARPAQARAVKVTPATEQTTDQRVSATGTLAADEQVVLGTKVAGRVAELPVDLGSRAQARPGRGAPRSHRRPAPRRSVGGRAPAGAGAARALARRAPTTAWTPSRRRSSGRRARCSTRPSSRASARSASCSSSSSPTPSSTRRWPALEVAEGRYQDAARGGAESPGHACCSGAPSSSWRASSSSTPWCVSPIDGAVSERKASVGEFLAAGAPVVTLVKIHPLRLRLAVPEREASGRARRADRPRHGGGRERASTRDAWRACRPSITRAEPLARSSRPRCPTRAGALRPGAFAKADIVVAGDVRMVTVPASAARRLRGRREGPHRRQGQGGRACACRPGRRLGDRVEIVAGLPPARRSSPSPATSTAGQPVHACEP